LLPEWKAAANWARYASSIVGYGEYHGGKVGAVSRGALAGKTYDLTTDAGVVAALKDVLEALGAKD
jgi:hypothetical protein